MFAAGPHVPVHPWFVPRDFDCADDPQHPAGSHLYGSDVWQESLFHVLLASGATEVLWWKPGHMRPLDVGVDLLSATLSELESILNHDLGIHRGRGGCTGAHMVPVTSPATAIESWDAQFILSGASVRCNTSNASTPVALYRFTPRCWFDPTDVSTRWCPHRPASLRNGSAAEFKVGSGFELSPVKGAKLVVPEKPVGPLGVWLVG